MHEPNATIYRVEFSLVTTRKNQITGEDLDQWLECNTKVVMARNESICSIEGVLTRSLKPNERLGAIRKVETIGTALLSDGIILTERKTQ